MLFSKQLALILACSLLWACQPTQEATSKGQVSFTILQLNDVYEIAPLEGGKVGGMARVETIQKQLQAQNPNTLTVHAGDFLSPSLIGTIKKEDGERIRGAQMIDVMNAVGFDCITFGNHEFDVKYPVLQKRLNESDFVWTSCNTFMDAKQTPFYKVEADEKKDLPLYVIKELKNEDGKSVKVGFIGVTLPFNKADYVVYEDIYASVRNTYDEIKDQVDLAIAITHLERAQDSTLAASVPELQLLIGGHDHNNMKFKVGNTTVTKADANAKTVYVHRFKYNLASKKTSFTSELVPVTDDIKDDPEVKKVVDKWLAKVNEILNSGGYNANEIICQTNKVLDGLETHIRNHPTELGYITAEAMRAQDESADFALINSGSIRVDDKLTGSITQYDVLRTFPFGGGITLLEMDGKAVKKLLKTGLETNKDMGGFMQTTRNISKKGGEYLIDGKSIEEGKTYKVLVSIFAAQGRESNLGFLKDYYSEAYEQDHQIFPSDVKNDIVDIVIAYLRTYE